MKGSYETEGLLGLVICIDLASYSDLEILRVFLSLAFFIRWRFYLQEYTEIESVDLQHKLYLTSLKVASTLTDFKVSLLRVSKSAIVLFLWVSCLFVSDELTSGNEKQYCAAPTKG